MRGMHGRQLTTAAAHAIRRRLAVAAHERPTHPAHAAPVEERQAQPAADDARLDALRGELVRELDRLAAADHACSAAFRRVA
jgi:hypothetical protein